MGDRYVNSDDSKNIIYVDSTILFEWFLSESLLFHEIEMWHGYPDLYINRLEEILNT